MVARELLEAASFYPNFHSIVHDAKFVSVCQTWSKKATTKSFETSFKDPLLTMTLSAPNEKQDKGNLGQKGLSDDTKVDFGATKDHG